MTKNEWLYICLDMLITHIPQKLESREGRDQVRELWDHLIEASNMLTSRFLARIEGLSGDDESMAIFKKRMGLDLVNIMQLLEHTSYYIYRMGANFLVTYKNFLEDEELYESFKQIPDFPYEYLDELD